MHPVMAEVPAPLKLPDAFMLSGSVDNGRVRHQLEDRTRR